MKRNRHYIKIQKEFKTERKLRLWGYGTAVKSNRGNDVIRYNPISIVIHFYVSFRRHFLATRWNIFAIPQIFVLFIHEFVPRRDENARISLTIAKRNSKSVFEGGGKKDHRVSTLAHLQIRSMNEHVYVHTNDVVVAALLSIARCNRTGNKLDPLVEEHHRAFLLNSRKRRNMRRVFVAFRVTVAAWHIPPDGKVSVVTNAYQPRGCGGCKCSRLLERHVPKVLYFVCNRFFQYGEHSGWLDWMGVCNKRSDARCMTTRFLYARVHGWL